MASYLPHNHPGESVVGKCERDTLSIQHMHKFHDSDSGREDRETSMYTTHWFYSDYDTFYTGQRSLLRRLCLSSKEYKQITREGTFERGREGEVLPSTVTKVCLARSVMKKRILCVTKENETERRESMPGGKERQQKRGKGMAWAQRDTH